MFNFANFLFSVSIRSFNFKFEMYFLLYELDIKLVMFPLSRNIPETIKYICVGYWKKKKSDFTLFVCLFSKM